MVEDSVSGFLAAFGAIIAFGFYSTPMKVKSVQDANVDGVVFIMYAGVAVSLTSLLVLSWNEFVFSWWGLLGASLWVTSQSLAFVAVSLLGVALGPPIWAGITIIMSFLWGVLLFDEQVRSIPLCIVAIILLIVGIAGVSACSDIANMITKKADHVVDHDHEYEDDGRDHESHPGEAKSLLDSSSKHTHIQTHEKDSLVWQRRLLGIVCAVVMGLMNGSLLVPFSLFLEDENSADAAAYLVSFAFGLFIAMPVLFAVFCVSRRSIPQMHFRVAALPGLLSGLLWSAGNYGSIYATLYLGNTVGYPLTQTCILVSGLLGVFYYREITGQAVWIFAASATVLLGAAAMLSYYGSQS